MRAILDSMTTQERVVVMKRVVRKKTSSDVVGGNPAPK